MQIPGAYIIFKIQFTIHTLLAEELKAHFSNIEHDAADVRHHFQETHKQLVKQHSCALSNMVSLTRWNQPLNKHKQEYFSLQQPLQFAAAK